MAFDRERLAPAIAAGPPARLVVLFGSAAKGPMHARGYASVDFARIWAELPTGIQSLENFAKAIGERLGSS